jgi:glycosyltransferase involved in cell wall biosynthesis
MSRPEAHRKIVNQQMTNNIRQRGVLFVHLAAARNGAAIALLHFLRWLNRNGSRPFSILLSESGELLSEFAAVGNTRLAGSSRWCPGGLRFQAARAVGLERLARAAERADLRSFAADCRPALVYLNGFASANFRLIEVLDLGIPILTHVHELGFLFRAQGGSATARMLSQTRRFIACSGAVKKNLIHEHRVESSRIDVVHPSIPVGDVHVQRSREDVLRELGFPNDALIVIGCGSAGWNKGTDIFVRLAQSVCKQRDRARFVWVGDSAGWMIPQYEHEVAMIGLTNKVRFTGLVNRPADYISAADVFVLPSREDSFPLACLEAAALSKPIVCFADSGGMPEFVEEDAGLIVPYLNVEAMAERLIALVDSSECRRLLGTTGRRKVAERHDVGTAAPPIASIIEKVIAEA